MSWPMFQFQVAHIEYGCSSRGSIHVLTGRWNSEAVDAGPVILGAVTWPHSDN